MSSSTLGWGYRTADDRIEIALGGRNLTDQAWAYTAAVIDGGVLWMADPPHLVGELSLRHLKRRPTMGKAHVENLSWRQVEAEDWHPEGLPPGIQWRPFEHLSECRRLHRPPRTADGFRFPQRLGLQRRMATVRAERRSANGQQSAGDRCLLLSFPPVQRRAAGQPRNLFGHWPLPTAHPDFRPSKPCPAIARYHPVPGQLAARMDGSAFGVRRRARRIAPG